MASLSVEEQIAALRATTGFAARFHEWLLLAAALGLVAAIVLWHPVPLMISAFLAIIGIAERRAGPNVVAAIRAYDSGTPTLGEVSIAVTCCDTTDRYHVRVHEQGHPDWEYEFIPQGWQPTQRSCAARIWRTRDGGQPVLTVVEEGVMIPRYDPRSARSA